MVDIYYFYYYKQYRNQFISEDFRPQQINRNTWDIAQVDIAFMWIIKINSRFFKYLV